MTPLVGRHICRQEPVAGFVLDAPLGDAIDANFWGGIDEWAFGCFDTGIQHPQSPLDGYRKIEREEKFEAAA